MSLTQTFKMALGAICLGAIFVFSGPLTPSSFAQTTLTSEPVSEDKVTLELESELWESTQTAILYVSLQAAFDGKDASEIRRNILNSLNELSKDTDWHITSFSRAPGAAGLEQWNVLAETRVMEQNVDGLRAKIKAKNRPGYQIDLRAVSFTPTTAEKQATFLKLRKAIYKQVGEELAALKAAFPDRQWRISRIEFSPSAVQTRRAASLDNPQVKTFSVERANALPSADNMSVSQKVKLYAQVVLSSSHRPLK